jgi:hypothetical protein
MPENIFQPLEAAYRALEQHVRRFGGRDMPRSSWLEPAPRDKLEKEVEKFGRGIRIIYT